jgi:(2R)-ethylmalonyl-CoA mutase
LTPAQIVAAAVEEDVHVIGLSILSGSHMEAVPTVLEGLRASGAGDVPVIVGGIIPDSDAAKLKALGVAAVFTPKDFNMTEVMNRIVDVIRDANGLS